jgi:hypothetical protein
VTRGNNVSIPRSKQRSLKLQEDEQVPVSTIKPKTDPPSFAENNSVHVKEENKAYCNKLLLLWKSVRYLCSTDQVNPRFVGWVILMFKRFLAKKLR